MWTFLPSRLVVTVLCTAALGACGDITVPDTTSPAFHAAPASEATNIQFGDFALHLPANVHHVRGILLALGGPDTRGFAVGTPFGAPPPVEPLLQDLGARFRALAAERGLAILGSGRFGPRAYPNVPASDQVIGAGAAGMAITDALLRHSDATVTIVDRRHAPGGHWIDAYPYVRLHQPSAFYGVDSTPLGEDAIDDTGWNAGYYELATADDIRSYFGRVMERRFLASGRVRYFPNCDYLGDRRVAARLTGASWELYVTRKIIDTTYVEGEIPATSAPPFAVADGVRCVPAGAITRLDQRADDFVVIGAGKTAIDTYIWLLEQGVDPGSIRWIKPREGWWLNRRFYQPQTQLPEMYRGLAIQVDGDGARYLPS